MAVLFGEPDSQAYRLGRKGFQSLLEEVDRLDDRTAAARTLGAPEEAMKQYLETTFLGSYFTHRRQNPVYLHHAANLVSAIDYLRARELDPLHEVYLQLFAYASFVEIHDPWTLMKNCLEFVGDPEHQYDPAILKGEFSAARKLKSVHSARNSGPDLTLPVFDQLLDFLDELVGPDLRNAIAHSTYSIDLRSETVTTQNRAGEPQRFSFQKIRDYSMNAADYLEGYREAVTLFAKEVVPDCPYALSWGPRY